MSEGKIEYVKLYHKPGMVKRDIFKVEYSKGMTFWDLYVKLYNDHKNYSKYGLKDDPPHCYSCRYFTDRNRWLYVEPKYEDEIDDLDHEYELFVWKPVIRNLTRIYKLEAKRVGQHIDDILLVRPYSMRNTFENILCSSGETDMQNTWSVVFKPKFDFATLSLNNDVPKPGFYSALLILTITQNVLAGLVKKEVSEKFGKKQKISLIPVDYDYKLPLDKFDHPIYESGIKLMQDKDMLEVGTHYRIANSSVIADCHGKLRRVELDDCTCWRDAIIKDFGGRQAGLTIDSDIVIEEGSTVIVKYANARIMLPNGQDIYVGSWDKPASFTVFMGKQTFPEALDDYHLFRNQEMTIPFHRDVELIYPEDTLYASKGIAKGTVIVTVKDKESQQSVSFGLLKQDRSWQNALIHICKCLGKNVDDYRLFPQDEIYDAEIPNGKFILLKRK